ncbi:hypothetical protein B0H16DRAFT_1502273 [Mycena metata]|uniref:Uncharacterized protein n=1 Tax=Mycena metata TaxID=1033252 RepID=A0AAD7K4K3_9AGAR|nr:hypothetical protein B0H16DRAFT_1502273 [Mycena metata]
MAPRQFSTSVDFCVSTMAWSPLLGARNVFRTSNSISSQIQKQRRIGARCFLVRQARLSRWNLRQSSTPSRWLDVIVSPTRSFRGFSAGVLPVCGLLCAHNVVCKRLGVEIHTLDLRLCVLQARSVRCAPKLPRQCGSTSAVLLHRLPRYPCECAF